eukprot:3811993-Rhodomonas_salina.1
MLVSACVLPLLIDPLTLLIPAPATVITPAPVVPRFPAPIVDAVATEYESASDTLPASAPA